MADASGGVVEVVLGEFVLRLDGTVVEVLHQTGLCHRFHVSHVAVEAKPGKDGGLKLNVGVDVSGIVMNGDRIAVPADRVADVTALFDAAKARRGT